MTCPRRPGGWVLLGAAVLAVACREPVAPEDEAAAIRAWAEGIRDYRAVAEVSVGDARVNSKIAGRRPDRLRLELEIRAGERRQSHLVVFDGTDEWVESTDASGRRVARLDARALSPPGRPFDTPYHLMGTGLLEGEDLPSTLVVLLTVFDVTAVRTGTDVAVFGPVNAARLREWAASRGPARSGRVDVDAFARELGYLEMDLVASSGYVPLRYSLGPARGRGSFVVRFREVEVNRGVPDALFVYAPPPGVEAEDLTGELRAAEAGGG